MRPWPKGGYFAQIWLLWQIWQFRYFYSGRIFLVADQLERSGRDKQKTIFWVNFNLFCLNKHTYFNLLLNVNASAT